MTIGRIRRVCGNGARTDLIGQGFESDRVMRALRAKRKPR